MKHISPLLFSFFMLGNPLFGADILELVRTLDANDTGTFKSLITTPDDANTMRSDNNKSILMYASWIGNSEAVEHLVASGAKVNVQDTNGVSALHLAAWKSNTPIALYLLQHGAFGNITSSDGMTPLDIARMKENQILAKEIEKTIPKLKPLL
ncbi:MAG: ankyrin repeat domain-containing protein [Sulfuricurvum sp.]|jgi:ankyrin repeat protein|uniref:ankyrin repeat domain-containing protein n=1 Tax=Sulfuricurvum sp. TaxID=2025608 RepID=UPI0025F73EAF|nr:ankyrin repeat domain-containing protein [Sulfuricurvum sp.]MCK9372096.1 ankyrin repeat domain-containing protein [Sulfuricurvum sp.]